MKRIIALAALLSSAAVADPACQYANPARLKEHLQKHLKFPMTGKAIKAACVKEWPDEFTDSERACCNRKLKDGVEYKTAAEVEKLLGV